MTTPETVFHVTSHDRLRSILAGGLDRKRRRRWNNMMGASLGDSRNLYFLRDFEQACRWAAHSEWNFSKPCVIIELLAPDGLVRDEGMQPGFGSSVRCQADVGAERILAAYPLTDAMRRKLTAFDGAPDKPEPVWANYAPMARPPLSV